LKDKNQLDIKILCTKEELLEHIWEYRHKDDYIRVGRHDDYDVCLELTWQQHSEPFVEYLYLANIIDNQLIGKIVKPQKKMIEKGKDKLPFLVKLQIVGMLLLGLLILYGLPFLIIYSLSDRLFLSLGLGVIPLIGFIIFIVVSDGDHISVHKRNIIKVINELGNQ